MTAAKDIVERLRASDSADPLIGEAILAIEALRAERDAARAEALRHAASRVRNATHTCMSEQHCDFLHAAHERVAKELEAEAAALASAPGESDT